MNFFFWFFLSFFLVASLQDFRRREVDNWLNLLLFFSGFLYVLLRVFLYNEISFLINFAFLVFFMFMLVNLFYLLKIFSGGDCKLLFATTPLLVSVGFIESFTNVLAFCFIILFVGAIYGLIWIFGLFFRNFKLNKKDLIIQLRKNYLVFVFALVLFFVGFLDRIFFSLSLFVMFLAILFFISKSVEKNSLIKEISTMDLREGDWLEKDIKIGGKTIKSSFEGLSLEDILFLKKHKKLIRVKDGIPYAPVFLFSWIVFYFLGIVMEFLASVLGV